MSDTGGGHRSAAEAISEALYRKYGRDTFKIELVDVYRKMNYPMNIQPEMYPEMVNKTPWLWGLGYYFANLPFIAPIVRRWLYITNYNRLQQMYQDHPADMIVSVHSVITPPSMYAYLAQKMTIPFLVVVTDLVSTPRFWYEKRAHHTYLPTQRAYERGKKLGLLPHRMTVTGLPVHPRFTNSPKDKATVRHEHGWSDDLPVVMLVFGGDGMGQLLQTATAINNKRLKCQLVIIAGKSEERKAQLEAMQWNQPTHIYGFITDMHDKMRGADILVTKAGPATITEATIAGLPLILSGKIPGQEDGNVWHVVDNKAGVYASRPKQVATILEQWLLDERIWHDYAQNAKKIALPDAVWQIAEGIWEHLHRPTKTDI
jgi:1,2-diacylglycerol 3-beta-galactosyltransferase